MSSHFLSSHPILHPQYMLRQGKSAVQALHEVEVLTTDYAGEDTPLMSADSGRQSAFSPMTVHTIIRGRLHIRTGNIGKYCKPVFDTGLLKSYYDVSDCADCTRHDC